MWTLFTFLVIIALGKFHGVIIPTTPIGWRINIISLVRVVPATILTRRIMKLTPQNKNKNQQIKTFSKHSLNH